MKIVLASPPAEGSNLGKGSLPPQGLLYVAAALQQVAGVEVAFVDAFAEGLYAEEAAERVLDLSPDMVGVSVMSTSIGRGLKLLTRVKRARPGISTILGGPHATLFDRLLLKEVPELDMVLRGEAEESFPELCRRLLASVELAGSPGLSYRSNGNGVSGEIQLVKNLDAIPFPARELLTYDGYYDKWGHWHIGAGGMVASILSSRGCPANCTFCTRISPEFGRWRARSIANIVEEVVKLSQEGYKVATFVDENLTINLNRVHELCHEIMRRQPDIRLAFQGFIHHLPQATLDLMKQAGFDFVFVGVESGSDAVRRLMRKPAKAHTIAEGVRRAKKARIVVLTAFITGTPGETAADHQASRNFIKEVSPHLLDVQIMKAHPGSQLWYDMVGTDQPATLEQSQSRMIYDFSGQPDRKTLERQRVELERVYIRTLLSFRGVLEAIRLIRGNESVRDALKAFVRNPGLLFQLFKTNVGKQ